MKIVKTLICGAIISTALTSYAIEPLDSVYTNLATREHTVTTDVKYSGTFSPDCTGFIFQQPDGEGWTKGVRLTVSGIAPEEGNRILGIFDDNEDEADVLIEHGTHRACQDKEIATAYAGYYDSDNQTFYFLRAEVEDKVCIPSDWYKRDYYYAPAQEADRKKSAYIPYPKSVNWPAALATLYTEMKYNSPFYTRNEQRIDSTYFAALEELKDADGYESYRILRKLAAACGDGHTFIFGYPSMATAPRWSPFSTVLLGDRLYIRSVDSDELEKAGMKRGMEILAIDGELPRDYATRELLPYIATSTPQWADHQMFDDYGFSEGRKDTQFTLTLSSDGGKHTKDITVTRNQRAIKPKNPRPSGPTFRIATGNIAILTLPNFATDEVRTFFDSVYPQILQSDGLVIDLRGNTGGNSGHADYILRHLTTDSIATDPWTTPVYRPAFASWGQRPGVYESPSGRMAPIEDKTPYLGPVAVITDRGTFSAAEDFCALFRDMKRGPIVGTPTAGSTGNGVRVLLTQNINANICSKHDRMPDGTEFVGIGIIPDIIIEETPESYFSDTTDIVLDKAISAIPARRN